MLFRSIITDGEKTLWIDVGEFGYGVPEWDLGVLWTMCNNMDPVRAENLFHVKPETLKAHWRLFISTYLAKDSLTLIQYLGALTIV